LPLNQSHVHSHSHKMTWVVMLWVPWNPAHFSSHAHLYSCKSPF